MKHYRATPIRGTPGEPVVGRGLRALYEAADAAWGMTATFASVRNNMLPTGRIYKTREGWVEIAAAPDADEAYEKAIENAAVNDDREEDYMANFVIVTMPDGDVEFAERRVRAKGLLNLIELAVQFTAGKLGGIPPCMEYDAIKKALPNMRSSLSRSRSKGVETFMLSFPPVKDGPMGWKAPNNWNVRIYVDIASKFEPMATNLRGFERRT